VPNQTDCPVLSPMSSAQGALKHIPAGPVRDARHKVSLRDYGWSGILIFSVNRGK
jgi:hypothetical protein